MSHSIFQIKIGEFVEKNNCHPRFLYIGTRQKRGLLQKLNLFNVHPREDINGKKYEGIEIVCVVRDDFLELG